MWATTEPLVKTGSGIGLKPFFAKKTPLETVLELHSALWAGAIFRVLAFRFSLASVQHVYNQILNSVNSDLLTL